MNLPALTIHQPWAGAIAHGPKRVENRTWQTYYRGWIAIHASAGRSPRWLLEHTIPRVADLSGQPIETVHKWIETRGMVVAVARLTSVCLASRYSASLLCDCGPWAMPRERHWHLADVRPLAEPIPATGAQKLWRLPDDVNARVRAAIGEDVRDAA